jgi:ABC-2 type transport system permease protein
MTLVATVARRRVVEMLSYPMEFFFGILALYAVFLILFFGVKAIGGPRLGAGDTLSAIAVGYVVFMLTQQSYQAISSQITRESTTGMLEQLALSPSGLLSVLLVDFFVQAFTSLVMVSFVMVGIMATTGRWLNFDVLSVVSLLVPTLVGVIGLGSVLGALALVFKRISAIAGFLSMSFVFLVAAPVDRYPLLKLLPIAHGNALLREVLVKGRSVFGFPGELALLLAVSFVYIGLGVIVFVFMDKQARERGLLGQY